LAKRSLEEALCSRARRAPYVRAVFDDGPKMERDCGAHLVLDLVERGTGRDAAG
jgi:hypothetical protein